MALVEDVSLWTCPRCGEQMASDIPVCSRCHAPPSPFPIHQLFTAGISFCKNGTFAVAQSIMLSPERPNIAAVACPGSSVRFTGNPTALIACVIALGCPIQYENAAAFTKQRIARLRAFVRNHSARVFVPDKRDPAESPARFNA